MLGTLSNQVIVDTEGSSLSLADKDIPIMDDARGLVGGAKLNKIKEVLEFLKDKNYDYVCMDSLTDISETIFDFAKTKYPEARQTMPMYGFIKETTKGFLKYCRDYPATIIFTCLEKDKLQDNGLRHVLPQVAGSMASEMIALFDLVLVLKSTIDDEGKIKRYVLTANNGEYQAKDRSGKLDTYEKPDLQAIINKAQGAKK